MSQTRIEQSVSSGFFTLDGEEFAVENNIWLIGNDQECVLIDAPHDPEAIAELVAGRRVVAIACTHAHDDHIRAAPAVAARFDAPIWLHPDDLPVWRLTHQLLPEPLADGQVFTVGQVSWEVRHTPGHTPGGVCFYAEELGVVFTGDTLFQGGPGATGRSFSDFPTIIESISSRLLTLPPQTIVHPGHGASSTIGAETPGLADWLTRGF